MALIDIAPSERVLIAGTSGSGKTFLLRNVLVPLYAVNPVIFDPKERWEPPDESWQIVDDFNPEHERQIIRMGDYAETDGPALWDEQMGNILRHGGHTVIVDELTLVTKPRAFPPYIRRAVFTGRDYKNGSVGVWMVTQRPAFVPTSAFSESRHLITFPLTRADDRERWARETHDQIIEELDALAQHDFVYYDTLMKRIVVVPAVLTSNAAEG
jgi:hypothetical protein